MRATDQTSEPVVRLRGIIKGFVEGGTRRVVLDGVDLEVAPATYLVVHGRSGTGKSTLLNLVAGLDAPDAGELCVAGEPIAELSERDRTLFRRRHIGFVFQFFNLVPTLTVEENLLLPLELIGGADGRHRERAAALLDRVGLADRAGTFPDRLSGGEQQRVAVARALIHDPELLLADEPTGNLDPEIGTEILDLLDELTRERGKTLLVATHSRELAARADRVVRIEEHRLVESGLEP